MAHATKSDIVRLSRFMDFNIQIFTSTHGKKISVYRILSKKPTYFHMHMCFLQRAMHFRTTFYFFIYFTSYFFIYFTFLITSADAVLNHSSFEHSCSSYLLISSHYEKFTLKQNRNIHNSVV